MTLQDQRSVVLLIKSDGLFLNYILLKLLTKFKNKTIFIFVLMAKS